MKKLQEMVVIKGRTIFHDGKKYAENSRIRLPEDEATRLKEAGFVVSLSEVRGMIIDHEPDLPDIPELLDVKASTIDTEKATAAEGVEADGQPEDETTEEVNSGKKSKTTKA